MSEPETKLPYVSPEIETSETFEEVAFICYDIDPGGCGQISKN